MRKTGLTPNESNIRGFTPGGLNSFGFGNHLVPGLSTPGALLNGPITPGLSSLLGIPPVSMPGMQQQPQQQQPSQQQQPPQQVPQQQVPVQQQPQQQPQQGHGMLNPMQSIPPAPEIHAIPAVSEQVPVPVPVPVPASVPVAVPPQTNDIPPPPQQQQPNPGIHTIPEVPPTTTTFNITPESNTSQDHDTTDLNSKPPAGGRKRKNSVKSPTTTKKAKTTKGKKKEPKSKVKAEVEADVSKDIVDDEREDIDQDEDDQGKDLDNQDSFTDNKPTDEKDTKKTTTARKGKGKKGVTDDEEKRKNFLERNRVAASKCRQRKKQLIQKMEDELAFYSTGYRELSAQVTSLRSQLLTLKGVIAGHRDCGAFVQYMGGFDALNELLNQADFATQVTEGVHTNMTSMPSTIPTTLNDVADNGDVSQDAVMPPSAPTTTMAPPLPITNITTANATSTHSNSRTETPDINFVTNNNGGGSQLTSHHSLNDLPAAAAAAAANNHGGTLGSKISNNGADLRSISSMSNLAAMNGNIAPF
ncbi:SKO1 Transcriptional regulator SKO1 [Candida maltosa Xu316]